MDETKDFSDEARFSLRYGDAIVAFGRRQVDAELSDPRWKSDYTDVVAQLLESENWSRRFIRIAGRIVFAIAGKSDLPDVYFISPDGRQIGASQRIRTLPGKSSFEEDGWRLVSAQEAMVHCGAYSLYRASEGSIAGCNERSRYA